MSSGDLHIEKLKKKDSFYKPLTKEQMSAKLAQGKADIAAGRCKNSKVMEKELAEEIGF